MYRRCCIIYVFFFFKVIKCKLLKESDRWIRKCVSTRNNTIWSAITPLKLKPDHAVLENTLERTTNISIPFPSHCQLSGGKKRLASNLNDRVTRYVIKLLWCSASIKVTELIGREIGMIYNIHIYTYWRKILEIEIFVYYYDLA